MGNLSSMKTFKTFITEAFDKPATWKKVIDNKDEKVYRWKIDKYKYELVAEDPNHKDSWDVSFTLENPTADKSFTYNATGTGNEMQVFATCIDIILKDLVPSVDPETITFSSEKSENDKETGRSKLYSRLIKRFLPSNYKVKNTENKIEIKFYISKK